MSRMVEMGVTIRVTGRIQLASRRAIQAEI